MYAIMCMRDDSGWCIIEQAIKMAAADGGWEYQPIKQYWVMLNSEEGEWYPHGKFGDINKAIKRMELIIDGQIEPW